MVIVTGVLMVITAVILADFLSGLAHWLEDSYFTASTPLLGHTIAKNVLHHLEPAAFVVNPWHVTVRSSLVCAVLVGAPLAFCGWLPWWAGLALSVSVFANQVHKWAHLPASRVPGPVQLLQRLGLMQTPSHHAAHHTGRKNLRSCVVTNVLNPALDASRFWRVLEIAVHVVSGCRPRPDVSQQPYNNRINPTAGGGLAADWRPHSHAAVPTEKSIRIESDRETNALVGAAYGRAC